MRLLHPALILIWRMHVYAIGRRLVTGMKTVRGALSTLVFAGAMSMSIFPLFFMGGSEDILNIFDSTFLADSPVSLQELPALVLFLICTASVVLQGTGTGIMFRPGDIDFLFPGPFKRRELVTLKQGRC